MKHIEYIIPIGEEAQDYDEMFIGVIRTHPKLVRCSDCKYYCGRSCTAHDAPGDYLTPDDFCSWAHQQRGKKNEPK